MQASDCFDAMLKHRLVKMSTLNPTKYSTPDVNMPADVEYDRHQTIATLLSGEAIARRFAEAAATQLGQHELALLVELFDNRDRSSHYREEGLRFHSG